MAQVLFAGPLSGGSTAASYTPQPIASTALTAGQALMINSTGAIVANDGTAPVIGYAPASGVAAGQPFTMQPPSAAAGLTGLVVGSTYYVQPDGSLGTTVTAAYAGVADSSTSLVSAPAGAAAAMVSTKLDKSGNDIGAVSSVQQFTKGIVADGISVQSASTTGVEITAIGTPSGTTAAYPTFLGTNVGVGNTGVNAVIIGRNNGASNSGVSPVIVGSLSGNNNTGANAVIVGASSGADNTGGNLVSIGFNNGTTNTGLNAIIIGASAGIGNTFANVVILGFGASATKANQAVIGGSTMTAVSLPAKIEPRAALPTYASDAAADADATLPSFALYKLTGNRAVFQKP